MGEEKELWKEVKIDNRRSTLNYYGKTKVNRTVSSKSFIYLKLKHDGVSPYKLVNHE